MPDPGHPPRGPRTLRDVAIARSGDKGQRATLSVVLHDPTHFDWLQAWLTAERVHGVYRHLVRGAVERHALPQLGALHFVMHEALGGGVTRSLALDAHGKSLSSAVLDLPIAAPPGMPSDASP